MELRQLRYFVAIVDYASLSKAANHLFVAQPALSQHVRQMEEGLKVKLLNRSSRGVTATEAGKRLYIHAQAILAQVAALGDTVRDTTENPVGEVRLGMSGTVSELVTVPLIEAARRQHPGIRIRPVEAMSGYVLDWLRNGEVDIALVYASKDPKGLAVHHVLTEELCLFGQKGARPFGARPRSALNLAEVLKLDLITPGLSHGLRKLIEEAALKLRRPLTPTLEIDSYNQIKKLGMIGAGYGILPQTAVAHEVKNGLLDVWHIRDPALRRRIYLSNATERPLSPAARAIAQLAWTVTRRLVKDRVWAATLAPGGDKAEFS